MKNKQKIKEDGITLVALVVTIIILLILAGVTLNIALSENGIFEKAKEAVEKYKNAEEDEVNVLDSLAEQLENINVDYSKYVGAKVTGYNPLTKTCEIGMIASGHTETQTFTTDTTDTAETGMQWRVWDFDGMTLRIIGDPTKNTLTLNGIAGYNNGVWAIEEICKECYSNGKSGVTVTSLKRSDIQKVSSYDYTQYKHYEDNYVEVIGNGETGKKLIHFGESKTYEKYNKYPQMWNVNDRNWKYGYNSATNVKTGSDQECTTWENVGEGEGKIQETEMTQGSSDTVFKQSYYYHNYKKEDFPNEKYYNLIFKKTDGQNDTGYFWLAGRYVHLYATSCDFGMQLVKSDSSDNSIGGNTLCSNREYEFVCAVRPIVSINIKSSKCKVETTYRRRWICKSM